ncbi:MAG: VacJ family lipoprotein [Methylococcaceae bacterium]|nr:VacJ family lipoprotein [Methylococcaceae bacterium]
MNSLHSGNGKILKTSLVLLIGALSLTGCATTTVEHQTIASAADPYEDVNRDIFAFNDTVDSYVAKPISDAYKWVTPQFLQTGIFNFFNNLKNVNVVINDVLQAKFEQSAEDTGRLLVNSTIGLGGLVDVAKDVGLPQNDEDFDQTLAVWGVPKGPYLVMPLLGPTTARGVPSSVLDTAANPASYIGMPIQLVSLLNSRANAQGSLDVVQEGALDPYVFIREGYLQTRDHLASDGKNQASLDVDSELGDNNVATTKTVTDKKVATDSTVAVADNANYNLRLSSADSFGGAARSFDATAKSFENANDKIDQLAKQQKTTKSRKAK